MLTDVFVAIYGVYCEVDITDNKVRIPNFLLDVGDGFLWSINKEDHNAPTSIRFGDYIYVGAYLMASGNGFGL